MPRADPSPAELLATPVQYLKGVGPRRAELLEKLSLRTARDLIFCFPRDYQDLTHLDSAANLQAGALTRLQARVIEIDQRTSGRGTSVLGALVRAGEKNVRLLWFNQPYMIGKLAIDQELLVTGKPRLHGGMCEIVHPQVQWLETADRPPDETLVPVYPLTEGLPQAQMRKIVHSVVQSHAGFLEEVFPEEFLSAHDLWPLHRALDQIHHPRDRASQQAARRRFVYQELFILQLALATRRHRQRHGVSAAAMESTAKIDARICRLFGFELTAGQRQAIAQVVADMGQPHPMNRLLQGDVGSGKTVVALYAILLAVAHGHQAVLMAPTEVLARQHAETLTQVLSASRVRWATLTGGLSGAERKQTLDEFARGDLDVVIGTQAILHEDVAPPRLGLVVIDEQHKFGVRQRARLKQAGVSPHYLVMTATPIPRTISMTVMGDLDVTVLADAPPGRQTVHTYLAAPDEREQWWNFFGEKIRSGRQGYVVAPLVDESDDLDAASVQQVFESLANGPLEAFRLDLLHGRMSPAGKHAAMAAFRKGDTQVLVATSVIEVGIDVPNATLLTIEGGERFGLSQLHQLRGRISRGNQVGYCCVFAESSGEQSRRRLEAFAETTDGFRLADLDFELRGPGDLLGTQQHGLPPLRVADLVRDGAIVEETRRDAWNLVTADPELAEPAHERLRRMTFNRYGRVLELGDVG